MTKYEGTYKCKWPGCGHEFSKVFGVAEGKKGGCSAVKCPRCGGPLKPKLDALTIREIKDKKGVTQHG